MTGAALLTGYCNPYGAETGGPARVLGGLHGPASATAPGSGLPQSVEQGEWTCRNPAVITVRMTCLCGHTGDRMPLCSWHDETSWRGELVGGTFRRVKQLVRVHGHFEEIQRRQAGACPRCLYPGRYAGFYKELLSWQGQLGMIRELGGWRSTRADVVRQRITDLVAGFDEGNASGQIHRCPMRLVPVS